MVSFQFLLSLTLSFATCLSAFKTNESTNITLPDKGMTASHELHKNEIYTNHEYNMHIERDPKTGLARTIYRLEHSPSTRRDMRQPQEIAREFVENHKHLMGIDDVISLLIFGVKTTPAGTTVRYQHRFNFINVYESLIVVTMDQKGDVTFVSSSYKPNIYVPSIEPRVDKEQAIRAMRNELGVRRLEHFDSELIVFVDNNQTSTLAWCITGEVMKEHSMSYEFIYDANTGENIQMKNLLMDKNGEKSVTRGIYNALEEQKFPEKNKNLRGLKSDGFTASFLKSMIFNQLLDSTFGIQKRNAIVRVDGTATVFDPNPLASGNKKYGDEGVIDNFDEGSSVLKALAKKVVLRDIAFDSKNYFLDGTYATQDDFDPPLTFLCNEPRFSSPTPDFQIDRSETLFEAASAYYHIDTIMRYVNEDLNIELMPTQYEGGVRFDSEGVDGKDNSYYNMQTQKMSFGSGGVDDAEDADVIIYELAYGFFDWLTLGGMSTVEGLAVGFGDYLANSYTRSKSNWTKDDEEYYWVFPWDGHNEFWNGRVTNYDGIYPDDIGKDTQQTDGQIFSTCNMKIWDALGREATDKVVMIGLSYISPLANQNDAIAAILTAAKDLNYTRDTYTTMSRIYASCGYSTVCGNGVIDAGEECDGPNIGIATCEDIGCNSNALPKCNSNCMLDYSSCDAGEDQINFRFDLTPDDNSEQTSWALSDTNSRVFESRQFGYYSSYECSFLNDCVHRHIMCLSKACYNFAIYDSAGDGICCSDGNGKYEIYVDGVNIEGSNASFGAVARHQIGSCGSQ